MNELRERVRKFRDDRDWKQFHTPENLAKAISIEAGELLEHFLWDDKYDKEEVSDELADVIIYCMHMADSLGVNIKDIVNNKMNKNIQKKVLKEQV